MNRFLLLLSMLCLGCGGPLPTPMVQRLDDDQQAKVDKTWVNMLTPPDRLDRATLLDAIIMYNLHSLGVDRLDMVSEKDVPDGTIVMEVHFDRRDPTVDEFSIAFFDRSDAEQWREVYAQHEVEEHVEFVKNLMMGASVCDGEYGFHKEERSPPSIPDSDVQPRNWDEWCEMTRPRLKIIAEVAGPLTDETPAASTGDDMTMDARMDVLDPKTGG